ncbi:glycosyltransferase [Gordonia sp. HS-NH1]|uniref:glycosyltransferase family 2 protein n=1 Tax=Gordonia sp. HS-NH1 TaxID=1435068 RepID=UPI000AFC93EB
MTVTIAIPFSGTANGLIESVRSVYSQTADDWLLTLVSDGATDAVVDHLRAIEDERVTVVHDGRQLGLAARLNEISAACKTRILFRMDSDDIMHPRRVEIQSNRLLSGDLDILGTRAWVIDDGGLVRGKYSEPGAPKSPQEYFRSNVVSHPTVAGRATWFRDNPYDESMLRCQDMELWARTCKTVRLEKLDEPLLFYRISPVLSREKQALSSRFHRRVLRTHAPQIIGNNATRMRVCKSQCKQFVFSGVSICGLSAAMYKRKFEAISEIELDRVQQVCDRARRAGVPGWPDVPN